MPPERTDSNTSVAIKPPSSLQHKIGEIIEGNDTVSVQGAVSSFIVRLQTRNPIVRARKTFERVSVTGNLCDSSKPVSSVPKKSVSANAVPASIERHKSAVVALPALDCKNVVQASSSNVTSSRRRHAILPLLQQDKNKLLRSASVEQLKISADEYYSSRGSTPFDTRSHEDKLFEDFDLYCSPVVDVAELRASDIVYKYVYGKGSFGHVLAVDFEGTSFALKVSSKARIVEDKQLQHYIEENEILRSLDHSLICRVRGRFATANLCALLMDPVQHGDLYRVIYRRDKETNAHLPIGMSLFYLASLVIAMDYVHSRGIIFRDLKPENVMIDERGYVRLIDFGLARRVRYCKQATYDLTGEVTTVFKDKKAFTLCGSPEYIAPEILFKRGQTKAVDIWALGVVFYEMLTRTTPFSNLGRHTSLKDVFTNIALMPKIGFTFPKHFVDTERSRETGSLIKELLASNPSRRLGSIGATRDILSHRLFSEHTDMIRGIEGGTYQPEYIPPELVHQDFPSLSALPAVKCFTGDNGQFSDF